MAAANPLAPIEVGRGRNAWHHRAPWTGDSYECHSWRYVNAGCLFDTAAPNNLEKNVSVGPGVSFITSSHDIDDNLAHRLRPHARKPISVGAGTWIGAGEMILPGVTIGVACVIGQAQT